MPDLDDAFKSWKANPTSESMAGLVHTATPVLEQAMTSYAGRSSPILKARAKLLAMGAFKGFDPKRGAKLKTHLLIQLQPLRREGLKSGMPVHVPERMVYDRSSTDKARKAFESTFGREPSDTELADRTGLSVNRIRAVGQVPTVASSTQVSGISDPGVSSRSAEDEWLEFVYHELPPKDQMILDHRLGRHGRPQISNNDIAQKLSMSASAVTQRMTKIVARLQEGEGLDT